MLRGPHPGPTPRPPPDRSRLRPAEPIALNLLDLKIIHFMTNRLRVLRLDKTLRFRQSQNPGRDAGVNPHSDVTCSLFV